MRQLHDELDAVYTPLAQQRSELIEDIGRIAADIIYEAQSDRESELLRSIGLSHLSSAAGNGAGGLGVSGVGSSTPGVVRKVSRTANGDHVESTDEEPLKARNGDTKDEAVCSTDDMYQHSVDKETLQVSWLVDLLTSSIVRFLSLMCGVHLGTCFVRVNDVAGSSRSFFTLHL